MGSSLKCYGGVWMLVAIAVSVVITESYALRLLSLPDGEQVACFNDQKRNRTSIFMVLKLYVDKMNSRPESTDRDFMREFCDKRNLEVKGLKLTFEMLSLSNEMEENFVLDTVHFEYRLRFPNQFADQILLGATTGGKWADLSDTSYIQKQAYSFSFDSIHADQCLYLNVTAFLRRYTVRPCKRAADYQAPTAIVMCKSVVNGFICDAPKGHLLRPKDEVAEIKTVESGSASSTIRPLRGANNVSIDLNDLDADDFLMMDLPSTIFNYEGLVLGPPEFVTAHLKNNKKKRRRRRGSTTRLRGSLLWAGLASTAGLLLTTATVV